MTRQQYKSLGTHWSVMDAGIRSKDKRADFFATFDLACRWAFGPWKDKKMAKIIYGYAPKENSVLP